MSRDYGCTVCGGWLFGSHRDDCPIVTYNELHLACERLVAAWDALGYGDEETAVELKGILTAIEQGRRK